MASTPLRHMRIDDETWDAYSAATASRDTDNTKAAKAFMAWFARLPGAKLPVRPPIAEVAPVVQDE